MRRFLFAVPAMAVLMIAAAAWPASAATGGWTAAKAPVPSGAQRRPPEAGLNGVACASASSCLAVGAYTAAGGSEQGLLLTRASGRWTAAQAPSPPVVAGQNVPVVAACSSSGECIALDSYNDGPVLLAETGGTWSAVDVAAPGGGSNLDLTAAACWATGCAATGSYGGGASSAALAVVTGSGSSWTASNVPISLGPAENGTQLHVSAMSCDSGGTCEAAGYYYFSPGPGPEDIVNEPITINGSGGSWSAELAPLPHNALTYVYAQSYPMDQLRAVSCPARSGACVAAGGYTTTADNQDGLILAGSRAVASPAPAGATAGADLTAVRCTAPRACTLGGSYNTAPSGDPGVYQGMILTGAGSAWTVASGPLPLPSDADTTQQNVQVSAVSCASASYCTAFGSYLGPAGTEQMLSVGNDGTWSSVDPPLPGTGNAFPAVNGLACSTRACYAAGSYEKSSGDNGYGLIETSTAP